jgi:hypothetical protein
MSTNLTAVLQEVLQNTTNLKVLQQLMTSGTNVSTHMIAGRAAKLILG